MPAESVNLMRNSAGRRRGWSVLELVVAIAILAALTTGMIQALDGVEERAREQTAHAELGQLRSALQRFRQDTGFLPVQGPFRLIADDGAVPLANVPGYVSPELAPAWAYSPANFWQLYVNPLAGTGHPLEQWDPVRGRGWNGPYLTHFGEGFVSIGDDIDEETGGGDPAFGQLLPDLFGVADPFPAVPLGAFLQWRTTPGGPPRTEWGRPYLMIELSDPDNAAVVSFGRNGIWELGGGDDIRMEVLR